MHQTIDVLGIVAGLLDIAVVGALVDLVAHLTFATIVGQGKGMLDHIVTKLIV